ncbi:hypothetical protein [Anaerosolibacter sp.]|uniref:hypothetical protein n=1 Tax=Anaerosolibacter sp. TaxID=1872527 RepID=UPI0039EF852A
MYNTNQLICLLVSVGLATGAMINELPPPAYILMMTALSIEFCRAVSPLVKLHPEVIAIILSSVIGLLCLIFLKLAEIYLIDIHEYEMELRTARIGLCLFYLYVLITSARKNMSG